MKTRLRFPLKSPIVIRNQDRTNHTLSSQLDCKDLVRPFFLCDSHGAWVAACDEKSSFFTTFSY